MRLQRFRVVIVVLASLASVACGGGGGGHETPVTTASITIVSGNHQTGVTSAALTTALGVSVKDGSGRAVQGASVSWTVVVGGGSVTPVTSTTDSAGLATTNWTLGAAPGTNRVTALVAGLTPVTFDATAVTGATASVTVTSTVQRIYEGDTVQLVATARDAAGHVLPGQSATWSSGNPTLCPVSTTGVLSTWTSGSVQVTATIDGVVGSLGLAIVPIEVEVAFGTKEVAHDWNSDRCEIMDVIDGPARFVRAEDGSLVLFDGNAPNYYVSRGTNFASMRRDCSAPALVSALRSTPESYENVEWLWAIYREGSTWHALIHNEFHDAAAAGCQPGNPFPGNPCWYNSVTYAVSMNDAHSFSKRGAPAHVVAPAPNAWIPPLGGVPVGNGFVEGYFNPSSIVHAADGYYYAFLMAIPTQSWTVAQGLCSFRTQTLGDPASWRAWDGSGFNLRMTSPYGSGGPAPVCTFLDTLMTHSHVVYSTYLERYMAVASGQGPLDVDGRPTCGFFYALSADLVHWSKHRLLAEASLPWCPAGPNALEPVNVLYPSIVDHADTTVNFERAGSTPYFYYVRFNDGGLDRDLMRVPLTLTRAN
jgi:hypothetical protein